MAYRVRQIATIKYGHFGEYLATVTKLQEIAQARGWSAARVLVPTAGQSNEIIIEQEYPDLATFQAENEAFYDDDEAFQAFRAGAPFVVEASARTEILEDLPLTFPS